MRHGLLALAVCLSSIAVQAIELEVLSRTDLPKRYHYAQDVRWMDGTRVVIAAGHDHGLLSVQLPSGMVETLSAGGSDLWASQVAAANDRIFFAAPFGTIGWTERANPDARVLIPLSSPNDLDAHGNEVAVFGTQRDGKGRYAPEGALAWKGTIHDGSIRWKPVFFSEAGAGAKPFARCVTLELDAIRYLGDGSLVIAPGVQPGVYRYAPSGKLVTAWQSSAIGFHDRCEVSEEDWRSLRVDPDFRMRWINRNVVLDEILPLEHPTLLVRRSDGKRTTWEWVELLPGGKIKKSAFPIRSDSPHTRIQADVRDGKIVFLLSSGTVESPQEGPRLIVARIK